MLKKRPILLLILTGILFFRPLTAFSLEGPFRVKNQFPLFLHLNTPIMEKAAQEDALTLSLQYSSVFLKKKSADWLVDLDLELAELALGYKKNFPGWIELGLEFPWWVSAAGSWINPWKAITRPSASRITAAAIPEK